MNVPEAGQKRLVVVGATGMVGRYALRYALENSAVGSVTSIGRSNVGISHPKLTEILHRDFADCSALAETLSGQDAAVFCRAHILARSLGRKSWLFAGSDRGGERAAIMFTLIQTRSSTTSIRKPGSPTSSPASPITRSPGSLTCCPGTGA
jgi:hypothetical protein